MFPRSLIPLLLLASAGQLLARPHRSHTDSETSAGAGTGMASTGVPHHHHLKHNHTSVEASKTIKPAGSSTSVDATQTVQGGVRNNTDTSAGDSDSFEIHVLNKCSAEQTVGIFGVTSTFQMEQYGSTYCVPSGGSQVLNAPFTGIGLRLSATADAGLAEQWDPQLLFEFGYSAYEGSTGTAYDISMMNNANATIGMAVKVLPNGQGSQDCAAKICTPDNCPVDQGWTNPNQVDIGSPANAVCYKGKANFEVTYCP